MKHWKRVSALLLALVLCLALAAFGCETNTDEEWEAVGSDWRTWGLVDDYGTVTRSSETVNVCVCVTADSIELYYDEPSQVLLAQVTLPDGIEDADAAFNGVSFDDLNGDGDSDLTARFLYEDGTERTCIWYWDAGAAGFALQEDAA